ncbi:MAG: carbon storage regulator [Pirellulales bacterium]
MLVLSRKQGEKVDVGNTITVTVLGMRGNVVKLGIEAPLDVRIMRGELPNWAEALHTRDQQKHRAAEKLAV